MEKSVPTVVEQLRGGKTFGGARLKQSDSSTKDTTTVGTGSNIRDKSKIGNRFFDDEDFYDGEAAGPAAPPPPPMSVSASVEAWKVNSTFADILVEDKITHFSVVQRLVVPSLLRFNERKCIVPRDICVSAPTGSGKTIAYALPIVQTLYQQLQQHRDNGMPTRLRALVLLPSRELAAQVFRVFCRLSSNNSIKVALASGQKPFEEEQRQLTGKYNADARKALSSMVDLSSMTSNRKYYAEDSSTNTHGNSTVDILVCTPGRLLEHLQHTIGFTLQHLRFLVLDEADRLLGNAFHDWVRQLVQSAHSNEITHGFGQVGVLNGLGMVSGFGTDTGTRTGMKKQSANGEEEEEVEEVDVGVGAGVDINTGIKTATSEAWGMGMTTTNPSTFALSSLRQLFPTNSQPLQRLLFSATLTDNPRKLAMLGIRNPLIIRAGDSDITTLNKSSVGKRARDDVTTTKMEGGKTGKHSKEKKRGGDEGEGEEEEEDDNDDDSANGSDEEEREGEGEEEGGMDVDNEDNDLEETEEGDNDGKTQTMAAAPLSSTSGFILPSTLSESECVCEAARRPLLLIAILTEAFALPAFSGWHEQQQVHSSSSTKLSTPSSLPGHVVCTSKGDMCLIFSSSVETTHRLCRLLQIFNGQTKEHTRHLTDNEDDAVDNNESTSTSTSHSSKKQKSKGKEKEKEKGKEGKSDSNSKGNDLVFGGLVVEMNRLMSSSQRDAVMRQAAEGKIAILVSSDHMSRGIDLPCIRLVVNYDPPSFAKTYVHRVGRTARAGRHGHAVTMLKAGQVGTFHKLRATIGGGTVVPNHRNSSSSDGTVKNKRKKLVEINTLGVCKAMKSTEKLVSAKYTSALTSLSSLLASENTSK